MIKQLIKSPTAFLIIVTLPVLAYHIVKILLIDVDVLVLVIASSHPGVRCWLFDHPIATSKKLDASTHKPTGETQSIQNALEMRH